VPQNPPTPPKEMRNPFCYAHAQALAKPMAPRAPQHSHPTPQRHRSARRAPGLPQQQPPRCQITEVIYHWDQSKATCIRHEAGDQNPRTEPPCSQKHFPPRAETVALRWRSPNQKAVITSAPSAGQKPYQ